MILSYISVYSISFSSANIFLRPFIWTENGQITPIVALAARIFEQILNCRNHLNEFHTNIKKLIHFDLLKNFQALLFLDSVIQRLL